MSLENLVGKKALVFGGGISGIGAALLLEKKGILPVIYDGNKKLTEADVLSKLPKTTKAQVVIGNLPEELLATVSLAVLSPGVPTDIPDVQRIRDRQIPIWGEIELAYRCSLGDVLAITGTNGKTTTTTLVGEILKYHVLQCERMGESIVASQDGVPFNDKSFVVGNIGTPYTEAALLTTEKTVTVAEISSFQLETTSAFHPKVTAITNITPDHLDRHHTLEEYIRVKERITEMQDGSDTVVLNYEDEVLRGFGLALRERDNAPKVFFFSSAKVLEDGISLRDGEIVICRNGVFTVVLPVKELKLPGTHNYENVMTAVAMTYAYGIPLEEIRHVIRVFTAVEHRIEYVAEKGGVIYYNDSKGTNPDAAIKAVEAMDRPTVLLAGGYDKGASYGEWIGRFPGRVKKLVLVGQTKEKIAQEADRRGFTDYVLTETFKEAFDACVAAAEKGDAVLLSPACASWGMFPNYEVRGHKFKEFVAQLED